MYILLYVYIFYLKIRTCLLAASQLTQHTRTHFCVIRLAAMLKYVYTAKIKLNNLNCCAPMLSARRTHTLTHNCTLSHAVCPSRFILSSTLITWIKAHAIFLNNGAHSRRKCCYFFQWALLIFTFWDCAVKYEASYFNKWPIILQLKTLLTEIPLLFFY